MSCFNRHDVFGLDIDFGLNNPGPICISAAVYTSHEVNPRAHGAMEDPVSYMDLQFLFGFDRFLLLLLDLETVDANKPRRVRVRRQLLGARYGIQNTIVLFTVKYYSNIVSNNLFLLDGRYTRCSLFCTEENEVLRALGSRLSPSSHEESLRLILAVWVANPYSIKPFTPRRQITF